MKERFEIYDGSAEAKKAKGKSKNLSGFHPLFTASARRSIVLDGLKIWLLLGFVVGVVTGVATGAGAVSVLLGLLIAAVIYFGFRDDVYKKVYGPEHDRGQLPLPEGMSWEEAIDRIRRGFANPDIEQVTDTADAMTFYSKKRGTYQLKNTADGLKMTILTKPSKSSKKEYLYAVFSSVLLSQVIAILYPEKISAEQVEEEKEAVRKLFGAHKMPLLIELAITAAFIAFAVYMLYPVLYSDSARSKGVSDSHLNGFPAEATVGEVLDDFFSDGKWDNFQQDGVTIVRYTGTGVDTENGEKVIVSLYFKRKDDGTGEIDRISWNGETLSELEQVGVILTLSNSYCESHGLASSNAIDNALNDVAGAVSDPESVTEEPVAASVNEVYLEGNESATLTEEIMTAAREYYENDVLPASERTRFQSLDKNELAIAWQDAMYTDIYECTSQADYARAWNRFVNYICFYAHIDGDTDKVSGYSDYYDVYMNGPVYAETDDEAEPYVDEVVKIAANNGAQIQF